MNTSSKPLRALRAQLITASDGGVIIRRGLTQVKVSGPDASRLTSAVYARCHGSLTASELFASFDNYDQEAVQQLVSHLLERKLIIAASHRRDEQETPLDIFYWHFGEDAIKRVSSSRLMVVGSSSLSSQCIKTLEASGFKDVLLVDDPALRQPCITRPGTSSCPPHFEPSREINYTVQRAPDEVSLTGIDCVVATAPFGGQDHLRQWNRHCVGRRAVFIPAVVHDCIAQIGPIVVPGQSACLECLRGRQNSHIGNIRDVRDVDKNVHEGREIIANHPAISDVAGSVLAMEITKFIGLGLLGQINRHIEINLLRSEMRVRNVLKLPYCSICSSESSTSAIDLSKMILRPRNER